MGLLLGLLIAYRRDSEGPRARRSGSIYRRTGLPLLWHGALGSHGEAPQGLRAVVAPYRGADFFAVDENRESANLALTLSSDARVERPQGRHAKPAEPSAILVANPRTPVREIALAAHRLDASGHDVAGVLLADAPRS